MVFEDAFIFFQMSLRCCWISLRHFTSAPGGSERYLSSFAVSPGVSECLWVIQTFEGKLWGEPEILCVFDIFGVSRDTQSNLGFFRSNPFFPDAWIFQNLSFLSFFFVFYSFRSLITVSSYFYSTYTSLKLIITKTLTLQVTE